MNARVTARCWKEKEINVPIALGAFRDKYVQCWKENEMNVPIALGAFRDKYVQCAVCSLVSVTSV